MDMDMDINPDTITLPTNRMNDLLFLCAHDFKHDFLEDKDRSGRAFGNSGYAGGSETIISEVNTTDPVLRVMNDKYSDDPETFPLACYLYLILGEKGFDGFCEKIDTFTKKLDEEKRQNEYDPKRKNQWVRRQTEYNDKIKRIRTNANQNERVSAATIETSDGGAPLKWNKKTGKEKYSELFSKFKEKDGIEKQRRSGRTRKIPQTLGTFDTSSAVPEPFKEKDAQKNRRIAA